MKVFKNFGERLKREYNEHLKGKFIAVIIVLLLCSMMLGGIFGFYAASNLFSNTIYKTLEEFGLEEEVRGLIRECLMRQGL